MQKIKVEASKLQGSLKLPASKSHTLRALLFAMLAKGESKIHNFLSSPDTDALITIMRDFGAKVVISNSTIIVTPTHFTWPTQKTLDCNNSGILLRFLTALCALTDKEITITGDAFLQEKRPMGPLIEALKLLGVKASYSKEKGFAPVKVQGPITQPLAKVEGQDSQFVSALLILGAFCSKGLDILVTNPGEKPWVDLTLSWFDYLGIPYEKSSDYTRFKLFGKACYKGFEYTIPSDFSSAAFPIAAAIITSSELTLSPIDMSDAQGDKKILSFLEQMGAKFAYNQKDQTLKILPGSQLTGQKFDLNDCIDSICIMSVIGCFAKGTTTLYNAAIARTKECDRIKVIASQLKKMNASIKETHDGLIIHHSKLQGTDLLSFHDHRIIMSLAVAGLGADGTTTIHNTQAINKTYTNFVKDLSEVQANIRHVL